MSIKIIWLVWLLLPDDEAEYCGWMFQENLLYTHHHPPTALSVHGFIPSEGGKPGSGEATSWLTAQASEWARRAKVWMSESINIQPASLLSQTDT